MHIDQFKKREDVGYTDEDGCYYENAVEFIQMGLFEFCECGNPEENLMYIRDALELIDYRVRALEDINSYNSKEWDVCCTLIEQKEIEVFGSESAAQFMYYWLHHEGLTEHGCSIPGWLTDKGKTLLADLNEMFPKAPQT